MRISEKLISDIDFISKLLGVTRSEWVKVKFAEFVREQKHELMEDLEHDFIYGRIKEADFKKLTGFAPTKGMIYAKMQSKNGAETYIKEAMKKVKG